MFIGTVDVLKDVRPDVLHSCHAALHDSMVADCCRFAAEHSARVTFATLRRSMVASAKRLSVKSAGPAAVMYCASQHSVDLTRG